MSTPLHDRLVAAVVQGIEILGPQLDELDVSKQIAWAAQDTVDFTREIEHEFGLLSGTEVGSLLGSESAAPRSMALDAHRAGRLLRIQRGSRYWYPGFQFHQGTVVPIIKPLRAAFGAHGWSERDTVFWLCAPTGYLDDARPVDLLDERPDDVLAAAHTYLDSDW